MMGTKPVLARIFEGGKAFMKTLHSTESIPQVTDAEAYESFDYTCKYYLGMSAGEFLDRWGAGKIPEDTPHLSRVLELLPLVK